MFDKLLTRTSRLAQPELDEQMLRKRELMRRSMTALHSISEIMVDQEIGDEELRSALLAKVSEEDFRGYVDTLAEWTTGKRRDPF